MKISFIIPYYNEPVWMLRECLESILALDIADDEREIIVVDDGSNRSPLEELGETVDNVTYARKDNGGLSSARNHGISIATGDYIQFIDSDDALQPAYGDILQLLRSRRADIIQFRFTREKADVNAGCSVTFDGNGVDRLCKRNLRGAACAYVFSRDILGDLRFKDGIYHEDELFTPQLFASAASIIDTDARAYFYRRRENSITMATDSAKKEKRLNDTLYVIETLSKLENKALKRRISQLTMDYIYTIIMQTHSRRILKERTARLRQSGLFPLPLKPYTAKYLLFALFTRLI